MRRMMAAACQTCSTYDADNRVSTITDPAGQKTTHTYDPDSRLYQVLDVNNQVSQTYHYTDGGQRPPSSSTGASRPAAAMQSFVRVPAFDELPKELRSQRSHQRDGAE